MYILQDVNGIGAWSACENEHTVESNNRTGNQRKKPRSSTPPKPEPPPNPTSQDPNLLTISGSSCRQERTATVCMHLQRVGVPSAVQMIPHLPRSAPQHIYTVLLLPHRKFRKFCKKPQTCLLPKNHRPRQPRLVQISAPQSPHAVPYRPRVEAKHKSKHSLEKTDSPFRRSLITSELNFRPTASFACT